MTCLTRLAKVLLIVFVAMAFLMLGAARLDGCGTTLGVLLVIAVLFKIFR